jgi:hypothetical protein
VPPGAVPDHPAPELVNVLFGRDAHCPAEAGTHAGSPPELRPARTVPPLAVL